MQEKENCEATGSGMEVDAIVTHSSERTVPTGF